MQRRRTSADIVNPSTSERSSNIVDIYDSSFSSHINNAFKPSSSFIVSSTNKSGSLPVNSSTSSFLQSTLSNIGGYAPVAISQQPVAQHIQLASINLACSDITDPDTHPSQLSLTVGRRQVKDTRGTFDNKVHGELSHKLQQNNHIRTSSHASVESPASLPKNIAMAPSGAFSLLTAPSSSESFVGEQVSSTSPIRGNAPTRVPNLAKESVKTYQHIEVLVDTATTIIHALWPYSEIGASKQAALDANVLGHFIRETLRKSRTSWSTMQLALLYCVRLRRDQITLARALISKAMTKGQPIDTIRSCLGSMCARKNFLSALILASKYLQDRNFSNKAWSKISSVPIGEISLREREFLEISQWNLHIKLEVFTQWASMTNNFLTDLHDSTIFGDAEACQNKWRGILRCLILNNNEEMLSIMSRFSEPVAAAAAAAAHDAATRQLSTPAATPGTEDRNSYSFVAEPLDQMQSRVTVMLPISPASETGHAEGSSHACPFFDEFIRSSPHQCADLEQQKAGPHDQTACYATPDSLSVISPASISENRGCVVEDHDAAHAAGFESLVGPLTVKDTFLLLTPQSIKAESTDSISSFECICVEATNSRKRGLTTEAQAASGVHVPGHDDMQKSSMQKRRRISVSSSRYT